MTTSNEGSEHSEVPEVPRDTESPEDLQVAAEIAKVLPPQFREAFHQAFDGSDGSTSIQSFIAAFSASLYTGPLPPPEQLKAYEEVLPGAANRIIKMAENQAEHRQVIEKISVKGGNSRSWWGLVLGFAISVIALGGSIYLATNGHTTAGVTIAGIDIVGLASVFVYGKSDQRKERVQKDAKTQLPAPRPGND